MKLMILIGITIFGSIGSGIGNLLDHQSFFNLMAFGGWSLLFTAIGSFFGIWVGYRVGRDYLG